MLSPKTLTEHVLRGELFVRRGFSLEINTPRNRAKRGLDILEEPVENEGHVDYVECMFGQLSQPHFLLPTCSGLRFLASEATDPEHRDASISVPCFLIPQNS